MSDIEMIISELKGIKETQTEQRDQLRELSHAMSKLAVQSEQITNLQIQNTSLWDKYDSLVGPNGVINHIRDHQAHCPENEMHRTFRWMWKIFIVQSGLIVMIIGCLIKSGI